MSVSVFVPSTAARERARVRAVIPAAQLFDDSFRSVACPSCTIHLFVLSTAALLFDRPHPNPLPQRGRGSTPVELSPC